MIRKAFITLLIMRGTRQLASTFQLNKKFKADIFLRINLNLIPTDEPKISDIIIV